MLAEGVVLAGASVATEMMIVSKVPIVKQIVVDNTVASVLFSTALSWLVGWLFGAGGLTVLLAALSSTVVSWVIYRGLKFMQTAGGLSISAA